MLYISDTSRYMNIVYIGMYLVYLVLAYKERLMSTVCFILAISIYLRAFIIVIYGKFNSSHSLFFSFFHVVSELCKSHL